MGQYKYLDYNGLKHLTNVISNTYPKNKDMEVINVSSIEDLYIYDDEGVLISSGMNFYSNKIYILNFDLPALYFNFIDKTDSPYWCIYFNTGSYATSLTDINGANSSNSLEQIYGLSKSSVNNLQSHTYYRLERFNEYNIFTRYGGADYPVNIQCCYNTYYKNHNMVLYKDSSLSASQYLNQYVDKYIGMSGVRLLTSISGNVDCGYLGNSFYIPAGSMYDSNPSRNMDYLLTGNTVNSLDYCNISGLNSLYNPSINVTTNIIDAQIMTHEYKSEIGVYNVTSDYEFGVYGLPLSSGYDINISCDNSSSKTPKACIWKYDSNLNPITYCMVEMGDYNLLDIIDQLGDQIGKFYLYIWLGWDDKFDNAQYPGMLNLRSFDEFICTTEVGAESSFSGIYKMINYVTIYRSSKSHPLILEINNNYNEGTFRYVSGVYNRLT